MIFQDNGEIIDDETCGESKDMILRNRFLNFYPLTICKGSDAIHTTMSSHTEPMTRKKEMMMSKTCPVHDVPSLDNLTIFTSANSDSLFEDYSSGNSNLRKY